MKMGLGKLLSLVAAVTLTGGTMTAHASALILKLESTPGSLVNVNDGAGLWQFDGGVISNETGTASLGHWTVSRRVVTGGNDSINHAAATLTLYGAGDPAETITMQGAHSYNNGKASGGVSAVTPGFKKYAKKRFTWDLSTGALVIQ